jgi:uncharacterized protein (TIRG00374 family)
MSEENDNGISLKRKNIVKIFIILVISVLLVWFLLREITLDDVRSVISNVQPLYIILGFGIYIIIYIFRALRFHFLLNKKIGFKDLFIIVCIHNMINKILPARTGELSYIYLLKRYNIPLEERIVTLAFARLFDFIFIALFFLLATFFLKDLPMVLVAVFWIIAICFLLLIILLISLLYYGDSFKKAIDKFAIKLRMDRFKTTKRILDVIGDTIMSFKVIKSRKIIVKTGILTALIWIVFFFIYFILTKAFQIELEFFEIIAIVSFMALLPLLPIYAFGGFGTTEITITILLMSFGVVESLAIVASFGIHVIGLLLTIILGLIGSFKWGLNIKPKSRDEENSE